MGLQVNDPLSLQQFFSDRVALSDSSHKDSLINADYTTMAIILKSLFKHKNCFLYFAGICKPLKRLVTHPLLISALQNFHILF